MENLTRIEMIELMAFIKTQINNNIGENMKEDISKIYLKLEKNINSIHVDTKEISNIRYGYNADSKNPIRYFLERENVTEILNYKDAINIAYAVIDSLGGKYDYLDELTDKFEED